MDALFHFANPDTRPYKKKNLSLVPTEFAKKNHQNYETEDDKEEEPLSPVIYKKKSHFFPNSGDTKSFGLALLTCKNEDDDGANVEIDDVPISPLKMEMNIKSASKDIHEKNPHIHSDRKSKTMMILPKKSFEDEEKPNAPEISEEIKQFKLYEREISQKKQDFDEEKLENIEDRDNDESISKNFQEKISKMNLVLTPINTHQAQLQHIKFSDNVKVNSSDCLKRQPKNKETEKIESIINNHSYRHLIFAPFCTESTFKKHLTLTYRGLVYSKKCLKGPSDSFIKSKHVNLVESKVPRYKTLLLDLDETLVHTCSLKENPEHVIKTIDAFGQENSIGLNIRPFCIEFLEKLCKYYEIFIFTASSSNYANTIINYIDPESKYINGILTRNNCMETKNGFFVKDLRIIKNRELKNMIIVDNLAHSFGFQIENGIPILEWHNNKKKDSELKYLMDYLLEILYADDVREFNKKRLRLTELAFMKLEDLML